MSTQLAELPPPQQHPVATHLRQCGIDRVLLIDDAFDPFDVAELQTEIGALWDQIVRSDDLKRELGSVRPNVEDRSQIDKELIDDLFLRREELLHLGPVCSSTLFADKLSKLPDLVSLKSHFDHIGIPVVELGSDEELPDELFKLIFLDYSLGPDDDATAVANARSRAAEIYRSSQSDAEKPFIVLISSKPDAAGAKEVFRDSSGLLNGLFGFVPKNELRDRDKLYMHLLTWAIGMPTRHTVQRFVEALGRSADEACKEFTRRVRALGVEDYANIQWLSLQPEGHPLGDYMLWLYKSLFAHMLHNHSGVLAEQKKLDALSFQEYTPSQFDPSLDLADIYRCALTDPGVEPLGPHPRAPEGSADPYLQLGDMFFQEGKTGVFIVLNAACDLAYAPGMKRKFPRDRFILLVRGELQPFEQTPRECSARTELFKHDGRVFRILWSFGRAIWKEYGQIGAWLQTEGYSRRERLALPYALDLQRSFAANFTRIGMPVTPPLRNADVEVYCEGEDREWMQLVPPVIGGARLVTRRLDETDKEVEQFALTLDAISAVVSGLGRAIELLRNRETQLNESIAQLGEPTEKEGQREAAKFRGQLTGVQGKLGRLEKLSRVSDSWLPLVKTPQTLPAAGSIEKVDMELLWFFRDHKFAGKYNAGPPIVIHICTNREVAAEVTSEPVPVTEDKTNEQ